MAYNPQPRPRGGAQPVRLHLHRRTGTPPRTVTNWFEDLLTKHRTRRITFHGLRHTHAAVMLTDWDIVWVSRRLGHATIEITDRTYGHLLAGVQRRFENRTFVEIVKAANASSTERTADAES